MLWLVMTLLPRSLLASRLLPAPAGGVRGPGEVEVRATSVPPAAAAQDSTPEGAADPSLLRPAAARSAG